MLREYALNPATGAVAALLSVRDDLALRTVRAYNARGMAGIVDPRRGSVVETRRLLTLARGAELRAA